MYEYIVKSNMHMWVCVWVCVFVCYLCSKVYRTGATVRTFKDSPLRASS